MPTANLRSGLWAMEHDALEVFVEANQGPPLASWTGPKTAEATAKENLEVNGRIALLTIDDVIVERASAGFFYGLGALELGQLVDRIAADSSIGAIVLDISSPGGEVYGTPELADKVYAARKRKPIIAVANAVAASGAFWLGSAASEFYVTPSGRVGSVGVIATHVDRSKQLDEAGLSVSVFRSVPNKQATSDTTKPISEAGAAELQEMVDSYHQVFEKSLAKFRGIGVAEVREKFGSGSMFRPEQALARGMVDGIATLDDIVGKLIKARKVTAQRKAKAKALGHKFGRQ